MSEFNLNNKTFSLIENSKNGKVNSETIFNYKQEGNIVTADYFGGSIKYGKIIATLNNNTLDMLYQCITTENELKAGKAIAKISLTTNNKMMLKLNWEWLGNKNESGISEYIEN
ncbi:hypothetical protein [Jejuia spongiicola]|uniref:N-acetylglutamate synthase n=1 Tax=Jejuia spongiicola TaxID=2942207 RepID=A0ABT0QIC5_9FLAO|nr:hypothetical protein [Jejuia spongiicola]MCL6295705.1 hypothetical protein [Jejuia spongiicola]